MTTLVAPIQLCKLPLISLNKPVWIVTADGFDYLSLSNQPQELKWMPLPLVITLICFAQLSTSATSSKTTFLKIYITCGAQGKVRHLFTVWGKTDLVQEAKIWEVALDYYTVQELCLLFTEPLSIQTIIIIST